MKSNLDVWAVQKNPNELVVALERVKKDSKNNILFSNCSCYMQIGSHSIVNKQFDTLLYAEDSDTFVLVQKNGDVGAEDIRNYLKKKDILFHEVVFELPDEFEEQSSDELKEIWIAREKTVFMDAVKNSKEQGFTHCEFYPEVTGNLDLQYFTFDQQKKEFEGRDFQGVVEFPDKIILLVQQQDKRNMKEREVYQVLSSQKVSVQVNYNTELCSLSEKSFEKVKK